METTSASPQLSEYRYDRRVQFYELDSAGIVHFSTYFRYFEEAEHALWRAAGLSIAPPGAAFGFPRIAASFEYQRPLQFEEQFEVHIRIAAIGTTSMRYDCAIRADGQPVAMGRVTIVCVRTHPGEPLVSIPIPPHIRARFAVAADATGTTGTGLGGRTTGTGPAGRGTGEHE